MSGLENDFMERFRFGAKPKSRKSSSDFKTNEFSSEPETREFSSNIQVKLSRERRRSFTDDEHYCNYSKPKGYALIINNHKFSESAKRKGLGDRTGTDVDRDNLYSVLCQIGYKVYVKNDVTAKDMLTAMENFAGKEEHNQCHSAVVVMLSHGMLGKIYGTDGGTNEVTALINCLNVDKCPQLMGKPKIFIIQACRNDPSLHMDGRSATEDRAAWERAVQGIFDMVRTDEASSSTTPGGADMLVAYSNMLGEAAARHATMGSWFIQSICDVFAEEAHKKEILHLFTTINRKVAEMQATIDDRVHVQMPDPHHRLLKKLYLMPGYFQETKGQQPINARNPGQSDGFNTKPQDWLKAYFPESHQQLRIVQPSELDGTIMKYPYVIALSIGPINDSSWINGAVRDQMRHFDDYASTNDDKKFILTVGPKAPGSITPYANRAAVGEDQLPRAPGKARMESNGVDKITIAWPAPSIDHNAIRQYKVHYQPKGQDGERVDINTGSTATTYTARNLEPGTAYVFKVLTKTAFGQSGWEEAGWSVPMMTKGHR